MTSNRAASILKHWLIAGHLRPRDAATAKTAPAHAADLAAGVKLVAEGVFDLACADSLGRIVQLVSADALSSFPRQRQIGWSEMVKVVGWGPRQQGAVPADEPEFGMAGSLGLRAVTIHVGRDQNEQSCAQLGLVLPARGYCADKRGLGGYTVATIDLDGTLQAFTYAFDLDVDHFINNEALGTARSMALHADLLPGQPTIDKALFPGATRYLADALPRLGAYFSALTQTST